MGRGTRGRVVATGVIVLLVVSGMTATVAAAPTLDVTVDGSGVGDGESITVTDDPQFRIEASGESSVESIEVMVGGETRHSFQPGSESFSELVELDIDDGEHEVRIVAEGSGTTEWTATIRKDSDGPRVSYTSPFSGPGQPTGTVVIEHSDATLAADLSDRSGVQLVRIERNYEWTFGGQSQRDRETYRISDPGENFSRPMLFGLGENSLRVEARDVHGQRTTHEITVRVEDAERPSIDLDRFERSGNTLEIAGVAEDNVKVRSLDVRVGRNRKSVLTETSKEPTRERLSAEFESTVQLTGDVQEVTLIATDVAGNTREWTVPIDYRGHIVPTIDIDDEATRIEGDSVAVTGTVTDGQFGRVVVETVDADGNVVSTATAYDGDTTDQVDVRARLGRADGETTVVVRAVDVDGEEHEETLTLDAGGSETATSAETVTPAATDAPSTPAATDAPSTPATTAAPAVDDAPQLALGGTTSRMPVPLPLPFPLSIPLPIPFAGTVVAVVVVGLAMAVSAVGEAGVEPGAGPAATDEPAAGTGESADRRDAASTAGGGTEPRDRERPGGATSTPRSDARGGETAPPPGHNGASPETGRPAGEPANDPSATGETGGSGGAAPEPEPEPEPAVDVTDHLGVGSMADVGADEVASLATELDADETETVATAARVLAALAEERPGLVAGTEAESRLRDLRLDPDPAVSEAASTAVRRLTDE
ncbi:hypothetical protein [Haloplanus salinarum]|uniref:hypothetical protein n=1 Tax=Haloplanus salinarum TaxID=1912324 RepID=UPI00214C1DA6|nr:hypothetical protein [Haloplanus salinarum]